MTTFKELKKEAKRIPALLAERAKPVKIALLGDSATQFLATAISGEAVRQGIVPDLYEAEYNQVERQILDPTSQLNEFQPQYLIVYQSSHKLLEHYSTLNDAQRENLANDRLEFIKTIIGAMPANCRIIYFNYAEIDDTVFGSYANKVPSSFTYQLRKLNYIVDEYASAVPNLSIFDLQAIQSKYGRDFMFDSNIYMSTEMLLSIDSLPIIAQNVVDIIAAYQGKFKKCLVLDLDNTLWGGVVSDDGWENVQIGHGLGIGKAFTEFQQWIKKIKQRGIILAINSKNYEEVAKEVFEKNPEMVLKLDDIAMFVANWENKADNLRFIQQTLNIGMDSIVFLDDNPAERAMVKEHIPEVTVPDLPADPGEYLEYLYSLNLFETASYSKADSDRTAQYQEQAQRAALQQKFTNEADFLKSLDMVSVVTGFNKFNTPRVAQLSQRSNQFNLRTVRYTEADITAIEVDKDKYATFSFTLEDRFGDNGLICVIILEKKDKETLFVDTWFMSCRVLKRGMENFTLNTIVDYAKANGFKRIIGEYLPSAKNKMVEEHFPGLGFTKLDGTETAQYILNVDSYEPRECYITTKEL